MLWTALFHIALDFAWYAGLLAYLGLGLLVIASAIVHRRPGWLVGILLGALLLTLPLWTAVLADVFSTHLSEQDPTNGAAAPNSTDAPNPAAG